MVESITVPEATLLSLEFPAILDLLQARCRSPYGVAAAQCLRPVASPEGVRKLRTLTREMLQYRQMAGNLPLSLSTDIRPILDRVEIEGSILSGAEVFLVASQMKLAQEVRTVLARSGLSALREIGRGLPDLGNLVRFLDGKVSAAGALEDRCSADLSRIRRQIAAVTVRLENALRELSARPEVARVLQDDFVALRNNRHVLPVRIDAQGSFEGIVHSLSSSGATVFIEPLATVPLNNELVRLKEEEEVEIQRLLREFSDLVRSRLADLRPVLDGLGEMDLLEAKAALAVEMAGIEPEEIDPAPGNRDRLLLTGARHPILERSLRPSGRPLVPLDLRLSGDQQILVVSGPNTGGKTVALKTVGLLAAMAQCGLWIPAEEARLPVFRRILIDIGDHQSIPESLSTFSARLSNISDMARLLDLPALILLDEVGGGTDPEEGAALGAAIVDFFRKRGALVLATTHHQGIKAYAASAPGASNASMEFDEDSRRPLYRLRAGVPGRSGGLDIAERLGLPEEMVRQAREFLPRQREQLEAYLRSLQALEEVLRGRIRAMEETAREDRRREAEREETARRLARDRENRFAQFLEESSSRIRDRGEEFLRDILDREAARRLREEMERREKVLFEEARTALDPDLVPPSAPPLHSPPVSPGAGDRVRVRTLGNVEGVVERADGDRITVRCGTKRLQVTRSDLTIPESPAPGRTVLPAGVRLIRSEDPAPAAEIVLIGKTVEEALPLLDKYLDDVSLASLSPVRIVHGTGTGRLRKAIWSFLGKHPHVEGFGEAEEKEGGRGATMVRIRL